MELLKALLLNELVLEINLDCSTRGVLPPLWPGPVNVRPSPSPTSLDANLR